MECLYMGTGRRGVPRHVANEKRKTPTAMHPVLDRDERHLLIKIEFLTIPSAHFEAGRDLMRISKRHKQAIASVIDVVEDSYSIGQRAYTGQKFGRTVSFVPGVTLNEEVARHPWQGLLEIHAKTTQEDLVIL